uniref:ubiquitinyl hydrolase 1 n=1 Tax=Kalanchoe fedtschenkoi TaxID=63787 RepID=A0A7N0SX63_KALFE
MSNQDPRCPRHRHLHPTSTCSLHKHKGSENDAVIARVLQEELSQAEAYRRAAGPECSHGQGNKAGCFRAPSHCCHHTGSSHAESSLNSMKVKDDESRLDGEVRKRIHQMDRIPHVPRINSRIPSADEATSDHQRLLNRLELYNLDELKVSGDGNCQFRSLSDQLYRSPEHHKAVRQQVVDQLRAHPELYAPYVPMPYHEYIMIISKLGEWGDHVTLQAASDWYGVTIFVLTSYKDTCYIEILPRLQKSKRVIFLSFWAEVHYNSIYPRGELGRHKGEHTRTKIRWKGTK